MNDIKLSVIIPALNEEEQLPKLLDFLTTNSTDATEIIVVDGGSTDDTFQLANQHGVEALRSEKGRAVQMNAGAKSAKGKIFYFLHADTLPHKDFESIILESMENYNAGSFRMKFEPNGWLLRKYAWFTRFNWRICRGGDRSLFITKELFEELGRYAEVPIMEDYILFSKTLKHGRFVSLKEEVVTSSRKYKKRGVITLQLLYGLIHLLWWLGVSEKRLSKLISKTQ